MAAATSITATGIAVGGEGEKVCELCLAFEFASRGKGTNPSFLRETRKRLLPSLFL